MATTITPNQVFLHEEDRYEPGQEYEVSPGLAAYFVNAGWADSPTLSAKSSQHALRLPVELTGETAEQTSTSEGA